jgi:chemotaxis methyl-accepting protein methylase
LDEVRKEVEQLLGTIYVQYGHDFRDYALASIYRRIRHRMMAERLTSIHQPEARLMARWLLYGGGSIFYGHSS